ncbi:RibD family protein [Xanthomonas fragariae]|uniref:RibD family protein n=1 Tax=Xanthomonas fragariae TaxID=48664 RepID=UPI001ABE3F27|nr:RibD family protein [Xanthomonas fragariae]UKR51862.1 RibD family protein [Xanthomonas fragariae]WAT13947.1 RibD family protein [Xanthomonas fragariae]
MAAWHLPFLMRYSMDRPLIVGKWAQTLDGQLAFDSGTPRWVSCAESRICAHWLRQRYDAILVGAGTAIVDKPTLTVRNSPLPIHRHPVRVLFDPSGRVFQVPDTRLASAARDTLQPRRAHRRLSQATANHFGRGSTD